MEEKYKLISIAVVVCFLLSTPYIYIICKYALPKSNYWNKRKIKKAKNVLKQICPNICIFFENQDLFFHRLKKENDIEINKKIFNKALSYFNAEYVSISCIINKQFYDMLFNIFFDDNLNVISLYCKKHCLDFNQVKNILSTTSYSPTSLYEHIIIPNFTKHNYSFVADLEMIMFRLIKVISQVYTQNKFNEDEFNYIIDRLL